VELAANPTGAVPDAASVRVRNRHRRGNVFWFKATPTRASAPPLHRREGETPTRACGLAGVDAGKFDVQAQLGVAFQARIGVYDKVRRSRPQPRFSRRREMELAKRLRQPKRDHVVEPFAVARYSCYWCRRVTLIDKDPLLIGMWRYLTHLRLKPAPAHQRRQRRNCTISMREPAI
jgi:hypothetical protein